MYCVLSTPFLCQKSVIDPKEVIVTCGNQSDPRIRLGVDVAQSLTLIFRSDSNGQKNKGVNLTIIEINSTAANVSAELCMYGICAFHCDNTVIQW